MKERLKHIGAAAAICLSVLCLAPSMPIKDGKLVNDLNANGKKILSLDISGSNLAAKTRLISTTAPLQGGGDLSADRALSITQASGSTNGYLSSTDWTAFNNKQGALTFPNSVQNTSGAVSLVNDSATPGNNMVYSTDGAGAKGWHTSSSAPTGANPTASVGTTAINGSAPTFMPSDAAPALDLSISPAWSGSHQFISAVTLGNAASVTGEIDFKFASGTRTLILKGSTPAGPATNTVLIPYTTDTLATLNGTESFTNKDLTSGTNTFPTLNQNTTGSAAKLTTPRAIYGNNFDGSAALAQIIASTFGGTGNGFTKFSGPTTAEKTKTVRDASDTILELGGTYTFTGGGFTNLRSTSPYITTGLNDTNGNSMLAFTPTASAVDGFTFTNAATANPATLTMAATGSDSNISIALTPKGTGVVEQRNGTNAQTHNVYKTYTDASNYNRLSITGSSITVQKAGTGTDQDFIINNATGFGLKFQTAGSTRWNINNTGNFLAENDNTNDIGASGANRPRTGYFGTSVIIGGVAVPTISSTDTLSNKRFTPRITSITSSATPTVNTDSADCVNITAQAAAITSMTTNLTGTPTDFDQLEYRIKDNGTARAITWGASFASGTGTLPTTTVVNKVLHVWFEWDSVQAKWICASTASEA